MQRPIKLSPFRHKSHSRGISLVSQEGQRSKSINTSVLNNISFDKSLLTNMDSLKSLGKQFTFQELNESKNNFHLNNHKSTTKHNQ